MLVATLFDFFIEAFETSPATKLIPEIINALRLLFLSIISAKHRVRLFLDKPSFTLEHRPEQRKEFVSIVLFLLASLGRHEVRLFRFIALEVFEMIVASGDQLFDFALVVGPGPEEMRDALCLSRRCKWGLGPTTIKTGLGYTLHTMPKCTGEFVYLKFS